MEFGTIWQDWVAMYQKIFSSSLILSFKWLFHASMSSENDTQMTQTTAFHTSELSLNYGDTIKLVQIITRPIIILFGTRMPFSWMPTSRLPIESQTLTIWPWEWLWPWCNLDLIYDLEIRQVKLMSGAKLAFSMKWPQPWPNDLGVTLTWFITLMSNKSNQVKLMSR